ncbi:MAG TPA: RNA polymerase factor sigma-54 [Gemmata sp.]|nr:RNA polymerase factor sigma-54 [Gemmata sp.]
MSGMRLGMDMVMRPDLKQVLAPRMIQSMEILQLSIADLQAKIEKALQENPFLEEREKHGEQDDRPAEFDPDSAPLKHDETGDLEFTRLDQLNRDWEGHFDEEPRVSRSALDEEGDRKLDAMANMANRPQSLQDHLAEQIGEMELDEEQRRLARHICSFIDRTGYLGTREKASEDSDKDTFHTISLAEIAGSYDLLVTEQEVEDALVHVVQKLEPAGVGARDLKECLLLQITPETPMGDVLRVLVRDHLEDIANNRVPVIQKSTKFDIPTIHDAIEALHHLDPKPGLKFADAETQYVMPDVIVERTDDDDFNIRLTDEWVPKIRISKRTVELIRNKDIPDDVKEQLRKKLQSADWLVKAVEQRRNTLLKVTRAIIEHQRAFLDAGPDHIQPLKMQQIADQVKVHVTTVSRAVDDKWVQTPRGVFPLKRFFGGGKANQQTGEDVAYEVMKQKLMELVSNEDKSNPLSDEELVTKLNEAGYPVARRTVTKYRKMLKIPSSRQRKDWSLGG